MTTPIGDAAPYVLAPFKNGIPEELREIDQWTTWRYEPSREKGQTKWGKVPRNAHTGHRASTTDPRTWTTFALAWAAYRKSLGADNPYSGVGFVFTRDDPFVGIDLDDAVAGDEVSVEAD